MKILACPAGYSIGDILGSEWYISYMLMKKLSERHKVEFVALAISSNISSSVPRIKVIEIGKGKPTYSTIERLRFWLKIPQYTMKILKEVNIDIVHHIAPSFVYRYGFNSVAPFIRHPFIIGPVYQPGTYQSKEELYAWYSYKRFVTLDSSLHALLSHLLLKSRAFEKTLEKCSVLVATTKKAKIAFSKFIKPEKIVVIPLGVDTDRFVPSKTPVNGDVIKILFAGALIKRKGVDYLLKAVRKLYKRGIKVKLEIIGDGPQRAYLEELSRLLHINDQVTFFGRIPRQELIKHYQKCDIICFPSLSDPFPSVPFEGMSCGKPVIVTSVCGVAEYIEHGKTGFIVPPADVDSLFNAILTLIESEDLRKRIGLNARSLVENKFSWDRISEQYYEVYKTVMR
jgi:glycosyltransferase involved in cell wall biosynthesis